MCRLNLGSAQPAKSHDYTVESQKKKIRTSGRRVKGAQKSR